MFLPDGNVVGAEKSHVLETLGRDVVEDLPRSGWPLMSSTEVKIAKVKEMVTENRHFSSRKIAAELSVYDRMYNFFFDR